MVDRFSVGGKANYSTPLCWSTFQFTLVVEEKGFHHVIVQLKLGHLGHQNKIYLLLCIRISQNMPELLKIALQLLKIYEEYKSTSSREDLRVEEVVRRESRNEYAV